MTKIRLWCSKHHKFIPFIITPLVLLLSLFIESSLFFDKLMKIEIADVDPYYVAKIVLITILGIFTFGLIKLLYPKWSFGFRKDGFKSGVKKYGTIILVAAIIRALSEYFGHIPLNHMPSLQRIIIEYFVYLICIGFYEEMLWRGLFLNSLRNIFAKSKYSSFIAVIISALAFGFVHIFDMLGEPVFEIFIKMLYVSAFGIFLGALYVKTKNIWIPMIAHNLMNFAGLPQFFSTQPYPDIAAYVSVSVYVLLGVFGFVIMLKVARNDNFSR